MYVLYPIRHLYNFYGAEVNRGQGHHLAYLDVLIDNSNDILQKATVFAQALISISSDLFFAQEEISMLSLHVRRRSQYVADCIYDSALGLRYPLFGLSPDIQYATCFDAVFILERLLNTYGDINITIPLVQRNINNLNI